MDYKEKYEKALERAKEFQKSKDGLCVLTAESIFPELKESGDERIRKALVRFHKSTIDVDGIKGEDILAWLEKQKSVGEIVERCKNSWYNEGKIAGQFEGISDDEKYQQGWHDALEKQGEQKPTDKVEPKFKVGDWIITKDKNVHKDYSICKIVEIENNRYHLENGDYLDIDTLEQYDYYLWTIDDVKDGDVLVDVYGNIGIFQKNDDFDWSSYCSLGPNGGFRCFAIEHELDRSHPATKEQHDLLFKKIEEAGYQWDAKKKELKLLISNGGDFESNNSKQKPVNDTIETIVEAVSNTSILDMIEDKDAFTNPGAFENSLGRLLKLFEKLPKQDLLDGLKFYANVVEHDGEYVKPAEWSDEDENGFGDTLWAINKARTIAKDENDMGNLWYAENWLKSLKERVQPKQEWSEEDEEIVNKIIDYIKPMPIFFESTKGKSGKEYTKEFVKETIDWLKSLKKRMS